jgi:hypothetical protein
MADRSRAYLRQEFSDGERPTGADFADLIDSFINKEDDLVRVVNGNLSVPAGITIANTATGPEGTLRFNGTQIEVFRGGSWNPIGGAGAFQPVNAGPHVAFTGGNVGIGSFGAPPTHRLEVPLAANSGPAQRVRLGNVAVHNGQDDAAYLSHHAQTGAQTYALRQDSAGVTTLNSGQNAQLVLSQQDTPRVQVSAGGDIVLNAQTSVSINGHTSIGSNAANRNLRVFGEAQKLAAGPFTAIASDARVKRDVRPLDAGLSELCRLDPVFFRFNGVAGMPDDDREHVGMVAQQVAEVVPFMAQRSSAASEEEGGIPDLLTYDPGPLTYMLINAVRELSDRVQKLEARLAAVEDER